MYISPYILALISGGFGIVGALTGTYLAHLLAILRSQYEDRRFAGIELRKAFETELATLQFESHDFKFKPFLEAAFLKHQMAVNNLRLFLSGKELTAFDEAWHEYYNYPGIDRHQGPFFTAKYTDDLLGITAAWQNIEAILAFAVPPKPSLLFWPFKK
jgi:hypothetical protein